MTFDKCDLCGQQLSPTNSVVWIEDSKILLVHPACYDQYAGKCPSCQQSANCELEKDHTQPLYIQQVRQQGVMRIQQQVLNPSLVNKHCRPGTCKCWNGKSCNKLQKNTCDNYKLK